MKLLTIQHKYKISNRVNQLDQPIQKFAMLLPAPLHFGTSLQLCDDLNIAQLHSTQGGYPVHMHHAIFNGLRLRKL